MPYNTDLDEEVLREEWEGQEGKIVVSVHSYNKGPKKLQLARIVKNRESQETYAKLGRLSKEELEGVLPLIQQALAAM